MNPFQYVSATNAKEAAGYIGENGRYLAGGIDLLSEMKDYIISPDILVKLNESTVSFSGIGAPASVIAEQNPSDAMANKQSVWIIGALTTITELAENPLIKKKLVGLSEAAAEVGSPQIRDMATIGGNLLQHSRCWYYRQPDIVCLKRGGQTCHGQAGENKYLSLFSGCACVTSFTSNLGVMLSALDATVILFADRHAKHPNDDLEIHKLYSEAWMNPLAHNSLNPKDILSAIKIPPKNANFRSAYRQVSEKREFDWALVSCAAAGNVTDGKITDARVVLGAVAPVPYMVEEANQFLQGKPLTEETAMMAADIILKDAKPLAQNGYKVPLAHTLIRRTLRALNA